MHSHPTSVPAGRRLAQVLVLSSLLLCMDSLKIGVTGLVSQRTGGDPAEGSNSSVALDKRGRFVAFVSEAANFVTIDTNGVDDVYVRDRKNSITSRASVGTLGFEPDGRSSEPSISSRGRCVAFTSEASNLAADDINGVADIFLRDRQRRTTQRISQTPDGSDADGASSAAAVSGNGRFVAFTSEATNLVPSDTNGVSDVFVHDRATQETTRVSVDSSGVAGNGDSSGVCISRRGRFVAFVSAADNLVSGDTNSTGDVFLHDRTTAETRRVSLDAASVEANGASARPSLSPRGRHIAYESLATNLVAGDTNGVRDIFWADLQTGSVLRVSVDDGGAQADGPSSYPSISRKGRMVSFQSAATNLDPADLNALEDVFLHGVMDGTTRMVSLGLFLSQPDGDSVQPRLSTNGRRLGFSSSATNLVENDLNGQDDVFVYRNR
jgi:Tol biopolymer transport system component